MELRVRRLLDEARSSRVLIERQRDELSAADGQIAKEKENSASLEKTNELLANELEHTTKALDYTTGAFKSERAAKQIVLKRNDELKGKVKFWRKFAVIAGGVAVGTVAGTILLK